MREGRNLVTIVVHLRSMSCVLCAPARHVQERRELYLFPQGWSRCHRHHEMDREATVERWSDFFYWCQVIPPPSQGVLAKPRVSIKETYTVCTQRGWDRGVRGHPIRPKPIPGGRVPDMGLHRCENNNLPRSLASCF